MNTKKPFRARVLQSDIENRLVRIRREQPELITPDYVKNFIHVEVEKWLHTRYKRGSITRQDFHAIRTGVDGYVFHPLVTLCNLHYHGQLKN